MLSFLRVVCISLIALEGFAQTQDVSFAPFITGPSVITASVKQSNDKLILAGNFIAIGATRITGGMVRLNTDGTIDNTFVVGSGTDYVRALLVQPDGKILVAGGFTKFNGQAVNKLIRLNADGSLDNTFNPGTGATNNPIDALALQPDNKIVVAGYFTIFNGITAKSIVRLNADGTLDATFTPVAIEFLGASSGDGRIALVIQPADGKILMGSYFSHVNGVAQPYLVRLNADGSLDNTFMTNLGTGLDNHITSIDLQSDGKIILGGRFTKVNSATANRNQVARLNTDGTLENTFNTNAGFNTGNSVQVVKVIAGDKILVSGNFQSPKKRILQLTSSGAVDNTFNPGTAFESNVGGFSTVDFIHVQSDNKIVATGEFGKYNGSFRLNLARVGSTGILETAYAPNPAGVATVYKTEVLSTGKILMCGNFLFVNGSYYPGIARLTAAGVLDNTFSVSGITFSFGEIGTFGIQPLTGKIIIGGDFQYTAGIARAGLARLLEDGAYDNTLTGFTTMILGSGGGVYAIETQTDDKIIIGGRFTSVNGTAKINFARLNAIGSLDNTFNTGGTDYSGRIIGINVRASDGKMILTQDIRDIGGQYAPLVNLANADGSRASTFDINAKFDGQFLTDAIFMTDGKILIGGDFNNYDGVKAHRLVKVDDAGVRDISFVNSGDYTNYKVGDLYYSSTLDKLFVGKAQLNFFSEPTDANSFDVMDSKGNVITDNLQVAGDIQSIVPIGSSFLVGGSITKVGSTNTTSLIRIDVPGAPTGAPTALSATTFNLQRRAVLTWTDNSSDEAGFEIQRSTTDNSNFALVATVPANAVTYTNKGDLVAATSYYYRVRAITIGGQTGFSNEANITTLAAEIPAPPTALVASVLEQNKIALSWIDNSSNESGFEIYRSAANNTSYSLLTTASSNATSFVNTGLSAATTYYYKIRAINSDEVSAYTGEVNQTTLASPPNEWSGALTTSLPARSDGVAITINGKAYVGLGRNGSGALKDWWEYDPSNNTWVQKLDFPGTARIGAVAFVVNGKGYVGTGNDFSGNGFKRDFYEYDAAANTWTSKADFPEDFNSAAGITAGSSFAIGNYGYVGLGNTGVNNTKAFFRYDAVANVWGSKADFGGSGRIAGVGFAANGKGYFGFGYGGLSANLKDMWEYDPNTNLWTKKADYTGPGRGGAAVAVINSEAFLFAGEEGDFSSSVRTNRNTQYNTQTNTWTSLATAPMSIRTDAMAFTIGTKVYVFDGVNSSTYYSDLFVFAPGSALVPKSPTAFTTNYISETSLKCVWTDASDDETNFVIEVAKGVGGSYITIASVPAGTIEFTQTGLTANTQYQYRIKAINSYGASSYVNGNIIYTSPPPAAPTNLDGVALSSTSIKLTWTDNATSETGFEVYRSTDGVSFAKIVTVAQSNAVEYTNTGLTPNTEYTYKVKAVNSIATSASDFSNSKAIRTSGVAPLAPSGFKVVSVTQTRVELSWTDNSTDETGFEVTRRSPNTIDVVTSISANGITFIDLQVLPQVTYTYSLRSVNVFGKSLAVELTVPVLLQAPEAPTELVAEVIPGTKIKIDWKDNSTFESGFEIFRNETFYKTVDKNATTFTDDSFLSELTYVYKVRAINSAGQSAFSNSVSATFPPNTITAIQDRLFGQHVVAYPNPVREELRVKNQSDVAVKLLLMNSVGQQIIVDELPPQSEKTISSAHWAPGLYLIKTSLPGESTIRFVRE